MLIQLGPVVVDRTALGVVVTIVLAFILLARETIATTRPGMKAVRYLDWAIAPLLIIFTLLIIEILLNP